MRKFDLFKLFMGVTACMLISCSDDDDDDSNTTDAAVSQKCDGNGQVKAADGTCVCDASEGYVKTSDGSCATGTGCDAYREVYVDDQAICECDTSRHWTGESNACQCTDGYVEQDDTCISGSEPPKPVCEGEGKMTNTEGNCICDADQGYVMTSSDVCSKETGCDPYRETYIESFELCECDVSRHWIGAASNCYCSSGFAEKDNACIPE